MGNSILIKEIFKLKHLQHFFYYYLQFPCLLRCGNSKKCRTCAETLFSITFATFTSHRLLESGRIQPRNVLIISNVDNRHHIDVVLAFNKYLKTHCAVGEVYFALDSNTGITSESTHDPWKWAQETMEKISQENGFIIFIAGTYVD